MAHLKSSKSHALVARLASVACDAGAIIASPLLRSWYSRWGATKAEVRCSLPADELIVFPKIQSTRAITISGQPPDIWPWLLLTLYGQSVTGPLNLELGTTIHMLPLIPAVTVDAVEVNRLIVLITRIDTLTGNTYSLFGKRPTHYVNSSRIFFLEKVTENETRLIVRSRFDCSAGLRNALLWRVFTDPVGSVRERKMLLEIKKRAEVNTKIDWRTAKKNIGLK